MGKLTNNQIYKGITTGAIRPNHNLTNMSVAYFQEQSDFIAPSVFPIINVPLSEGTYRKFNRADLARDNVQVKPEFGHVNPAVLSSESAKYSCEVEQIIMGEDLIQQTNYSRMNLPGSVDPRIGRSKAISEQIGLHLDAMFAKKFFQPGAWTNEWEGNASEDLDQKKFYKFTDANCNPIKLIRKLIRDNQRVTRRKLNYALMGVEVFDTLVQSEDMLARVLPGGSSINPAVVTEQALATLLGLDRVFVLESTMNTAPLGAEEKMEWVCDPKSMLLLSTPSAPAIDTPAAGYIFAWDMLANGSPYIIQEHDGHPLDHARFTEGLISYEMNKVCDDMGIFMKACV